MNPGRDSPPVASKLIALLPDHETLTFAMGWNALQAKVTPEGDLLDVCASTDVGDLTYYLNRPRLVATSTVSAATSWPVPKS